MKLLQKAFVINSEKLSEPWFCPDEVYYGESIGKVKLKALNDLEGLTDRYLQEHFTFLNCPVKRAPKLDKYLVDGVVKTLASIEYDLKVKERNDTLDKIISENPDGMAYIMKGGYYYRPNNCGYTEFISVAGIYPVKDAARSVKSCSLGDNMRMILINKDEHNAMINERIADLQSRLIA